MDREYERCVILAWCLVGMICIVLWSISNA